MKNKSILLLVIISFVSIYIFPNLTVAEIPPEQVKYYCTWLGKCKASGGGNLCAQSEPGGNIDCSIYNANC